MSLNWLAPVVLHMPCLTTPCCCWGSRNTLMSKRHGDSDMWPQNKDSYQLHIISFVQAYPRGEKNQVKEKLLKKNNDHAIFVDCQKNITGLKAAKDATLHSFILVRSCMYLLTFWHTIYQSLYSIAFILYIIWLFHDCFYFELNRQHPWPLAKGIRVFWGTWYNAPVMRDAS